MKAQTRIPRDKPIVFASYADFQKAVTVEIVKEEPEIFKRHAEQIIPQAFAMFFWTMALNYGWKKKRLRKLLDDLHETDRLMRNPSRLHHRFDPLDCEREIKEKYGIDLRKEIPIQVEIKK